MTKKLFSEEEKLDLNALNIEDKWFIVFVKSQIAKMIWSFVNCAVNNS